MEPCPTPIRRDVWLKRKRDVDPGLERLRSQLRSTTNAAVPLGVWCAGGGCARARALRNKWVLNSILGDVASADVYVCLCIRMRMSIRTRMCMCMRLCRGGYYRFYQVFPVGPVWPHWRPRVGIIQHSRTVMPIYRVTLGGASKALLGKIANLNKNFRVGTPAPWP